MGEDLEEERGREKGRATFGAPTMCQAVAISQLIFSAQRTAFVCEQTEA